MKIGNKNFTTIWAEKNSVKIIDQTELPFNFKIIKLKETKDFFYAIKNMQVRGAPLIGVTAAYALAMAIKKEPSTQNILRTYKKILSARPTAVNLRWALDLLKKKVLKLNEKDRIIESFKIADKIREDDINNCKKIGYYGCQIIKKIFKKKKRKINILTHCNAGWLATVDWGTALAPIYAASNNKIPIHVWVDETRPRNQGALLTAWELKHQKIPYTIIVDNAGGHLMQTGKVDLCIVGSDRTALNGDVCNKIGTYLKALSAFDNSIPFYVALPISTIDNTLPRGLNKINIESRSGKELTHVNVNSKNKRKISEIYFKNAKTYNPAFDVTPSKFITSLITDRGHVKASTRDIRKLLEQCI